MSEEMDGNIKEFIKDLRELKITPIEIDKTAHKLEIVNCMGFNGCAEQLNKEIDNLIFKWDYISETGVK